MRRIEDSVQRAGPRAASGMPREKPSRASINPGGGASFFFERRLCRRQRWGEVRKGGVPPSECKEERLGLPP